MDSVTLKIQHWEEVREIKGSLLKLPDLILASRGDIGPFRENYLKGSLAEESPAVPTGVQGVGKA